MRPATRTHSKVPALAAVLCSIALAVAPVGCSESGPAASSSAGPTGCDARPPAADATKDPPDIPGEDSPADDASSPVIVAPLPPGAKKHAETYRRDEKVPTGGVLGLCYIPCKGPQTVPRPDPVDVTEGPNKIVGPEPAELDYYRKIRLRRPAWVHTYSRAQGGHPVMYAVLLLRDVQAGPLPPLSRGELHVDNGVLMPLIRFSALGERVELRTFDAFSNRFVVTRCGTGEVLLKSGLPGNTATFRGSGALDKGNLGSWEKSQWMKLAKPIQTEPIREPGFFEIRCERHPWQVSYLVVHDNPYVAVSEGRHRARGIFRIGKVPVGTWTLEVWHPALEPVRKTLRVTVKQDETAEVLIPFKPPTTKQ